MSATCLFTWDVRLPR